jgi:hypothetical protein
MTDNTQYCGWEVRWLFLAVGIPVALIGGMFTASVIGAIIGIPLLLLAWPLLKNPVVARECPA